MPTQDLLLPENLLPWIEETWEDEIIPALIRYIAIPAKSPMFDARWVEHGHIDAAVELVVEACRKLGPERLAIEVVRLEGRTPLVLMELAASPGLEDAAPVLLYGHLDKQPEMSGWREGLGPWEPVREGDRLYGRGGGDDGYAAFASTLALAALARADVPRRRAVVLIEACEESGSYDLVHYIDALAERIGTPDLIVCLDSGAGDYERLWNTTSLRGISGGTLKVSMLKAGVHSGDASGIVPDSFRVMRMLLSRLEDEATGEIVAAFHGEIPAARQTQATAAGAILGDEVAGKFPFRDGATSVPGSPPELILARTWRPALSITGAGGLPEIANAGNVSRPVTSLKLSLRLPPNVDATIATRRLEELLVSDPPYGASVEFKADPPGSGWDAPALAPWLETAIDEASEAYFGPPAAHLGEGGSIPFMGMLAERFPAAQFLITGVLGPESNAHGPNEFLHLGVAKRLTGAVAHVLAALASR
jgi:acetylornithine deacetylase/succinyl-diaminopimelate desuccinylase-like protein